MTRATNFLAEIIGSKRERLAREICGRPLESIRAEATEARREAKAHAFREALADGTRVNVIAEIKRASPSKGAIRIDATPADLARAYESGGARAVSVLTEEEHFRGSLNDLRAVRAAVALPVLRKDFIFDEFQVYEAAAAGADALLLIVAALDRAALERLRQLTEEEMGMDALVEVHTADEMSQAHACGAKIIGVNNRDLRTFDVSLDVSLELAARAPAGALLVSESGLRTGSDLRRLRACGYRGFLIGEMLMRAERPEEALRALLLEAQIERDGTR